MKIAALCLVGFVLLSNFIDARPADGGGGHKHIHQHSSKADSSSSHKHQAGKVHHHTSQTGGSGGGAPGAAGGSGGGAPGDAGGSGGAPGGDTHHHHFTVGSDGKPGKGDTHHHHFKTGGTPHSHHFSNGPKGGPGGPGGPPGGDGPDGPGGPPGGDGPGGPHGPHGPHGSHGPHGPGGSHGPHGPGGSHGPHGPGGPSLPTGDLPGADGGPLNLGGLKIKGFSPDTIKKFTQILGDAGIDLNNLDLGNLDLGKLGLGGAGGIGGGLGLGGGGAHKFDGTDSLQPTMCDDSINDRYGVGKHFVRGTRDVGFAIVSEAEDILDPLLGFLTHGVGQGLKALLCALEDGFSDFGSDFDSATDIAKHGLVNFFKLQGPHPVLGIPVGIGGIAGEAVKAAASILGDGVSGIQDALGQLLTGGEAP